MPPLTPRHRTGFTIVELLIVVVVIAILAAVTIVAFTGITDRARETKIAFDTSSLAKEVEIMKIKTGSYPANISDVEGSDGEYQYKYTPGTNEFCLTTISGDGSAWNSSNNASAASGYCNGHTPSQMQVVSGNLYTCVVKLTSTYCWGDNAYGQLGEGGGDSISPVGVTMSGGLSGKTISSIDGGIAHTCALTLDGAAYCWGYNNYGQIGNSSTTTATTPVAVSTSGALSGKTIKAIAAGASHTCALTSDNGIYCWGYGGFGNLGNGTTTNATSPVAVTMSGVLSGKTVVDISAGLYHTCAQTDEGLLYCWGYNAYGQLGNGSITNATTPVAVSTSGALATRTVKAVTGGYYHTCAITSDDKVSCWGRNNYGQLGNNSTTDSSAPVMTQTSSMTFGDLVTSIKSLYNHTCAIATLGKAYCWGQGTNGQIGNGSTTNATTPEQVDTGGPFSSVAFKSISAGYYHGCGLTTLNTIYCWGQNADGQLGNGSTTASSVAVMSLVP